MTVAHQVADRSRTPSATWRRRRPAGRSSTASTKFGTTGRAGSRSSRTAWTRLRGTSDSADAYDGNEVSTAAGMNLEQGDIAHLNTVCLCRDFDMVGTSDKITSCA